MQRVNILPLGILFIYNSFVVDPKKIIVQSILF